MILDTNKWLPISLACKLYLNKRGRKLNRASIYFLIYAKKINRLIVYPGYSFVSVTDLQREFNEISSKPTR